MDEVIVADLAVREWIVEVEQAASCELTVINGGEIVATFDIQVEGVDQEWVNVYPAHINLNEGGKGIVNISFSPPRQPTSTAGIYHIAFIISSPNYPGHVCRIGASLTVNPYYEFTVGNLDPRKQSASWKKRIGIVNLPVINKGNSPALLRMVAQDDANGCQFEYHLNENEHLVRQADISVPSGGTTSVPISIRANKRELVRFGSRQYSYSVTTALVADPTAARVVMGTFSASPLFGTISILLGILLLLFLTYIIFLPRLNSFTSTPLVTSLGQPVTLAWKGSIFNDSFRLRYKYPEDTQFKDMPDEIKPGASQISVIPTNTFTTYSLVVGDWLSRLLPIPEVSKTSHSVLAIPPYPEISTFQVDKKDVSLGESVIVKYSIKNATSATLTVEDVPTVLAKEELSGEKTFKLNKNTIIVLVAKNDSGAVVQSEYIHVWDPKDIQYSFKVDPATVVSGNPVTVSWKVAGQGFKIDSVVVSPFAEPLPSEYKLTYYPTESMYFVLKVNVQGYEKSFPPEYVTVLPADAKPVINYFKATPPQLANGGNVEFSWSVSGPTDSVVISNKSGPVKSGLAAQGYETIPVSSTATYILTAKKGSQTAAAVVDVQVLSLLDVNIAITSILPSSGILRNDKVYIYYSVTPKIASNTAPEVSGSVVITDGFDNCEVKLPIATCEFVFHRSGSDKKLVATYSGDANYRRTSSGPFPATGGLSVIGSTVDIKNITFLYAAATTTSLTSSVGTQPLDVTATSYPYVGQTGTLQFDLLPTGSSTTPVQGVFDVFVDDTTPICIGQALAVAKDKDGNSIGRGQCKFLFDRVGSRTLKVRYQGNEIFEPLETDPTVNTTQAALNLTVSAAPTRINLLSQVPDKIAQVGQTVSLNMQVMVDGPGGNPVPGNGTLKVSDSNLKTYCNLPISATGTALCVFTPMQISAKLIFEFSSTSPNYLSYTTNCTTNCSGTEISYKITPATASVKIGTAQFIPAITGQANPIVGQRVAFNYQVIADASGAIIQSGILKVFLQDVINTTPVQICAIDLAKSPPNCDVLLSHGGKNIITTSFNDPAANFLQNTAASATYTADPLRVSIQNLTPVPDRAVEGASVTVSFTLVPPFTTLLSPVGNYSVQTNGTNESCSGVIPATTFCSFTLSGNSSLSRAITISFGDGRDYVPVTAKIDPYHVIHKSGITILGNTGSPLVNGSTQIQYAVTPDFVFPGMPAMTGTVKVHISLNGQEYGSCTATLADGACTLTILKPGDNLVWADFTPDANSDYGSSKSANFPLKVFKVTSTFSLFNPPLVSNIGDALTFTVRATRAAFPSDIAPPGGTAILSARRVSPPDNATAVCQNVIALQGTPNNYSEGSCTIRFPGAGVWELNVEYSGDPFYAAISPPVTLGVQHTVTKYPSMVFINSTNVKNNNLVDFNFTVTKGTPTFAAGLTGTVTLVDEVTPTLTCTASITQNPLNLNEWVGTCPIAFPSAGTYKVDGIYNGDDNFLSSQTITPTLVTIP